MIWYEVRAEVPAERADAYEAYLRGEHIPDLMDTGCFVEAGFCRADTGRTAPREEAEEGDGVSSPHVLFRSAYLAPNREALDRYVREHAPRLREHALGRFPDGLRFSREEWEVRERWGSAGPGGGTSER